MKELKIGRHEVEMNEFDEADLALADGAVTLAEEAGRGAAERAAELGRGGVAWFARSIEVRAMLMRGDRHGARARRRRVLPELSGGVRG